MPLDNSDFLPFPSHWQLKTIKEFAKIKGGKRLPLGKSLTPNKTTHPYIRIVDFKDGRVDKSNLLYVPENVFPEISRYIIRIKDIYISIVGTIGLVGVVDKELDGANLTENAAKICEIDDSVDRDFLKAYLQSGFGKHEIMTHTVGSTQPKLALFRIGDIRVPIPPLPEQRAIAGVLGALDDKIEVNQRMNVTLESLARAVFRQWFLDDQVVAGWKVGTVLGDFNLTMGQSPPGETYNENGEGLPFFQGRADFGTRFPNNRVYCTGPTRFANPGDTLVCVRAPVGDLNMASEKCAIGRGVAAIRHKSGSRSYTYYTMQSLEENFKQFEAEGTVFGSINKADFQNLKVVIPPPDVVEKFEEICFPLDQMIENNEKESRSLASLRDSLLPKLMSGEIRVKTS